MGASIQSVASEGGTSYATQYGHIFPLPPLLPAEPQIPKDSTELKRGLSQLGMQLVTSGAPWFLLSAVVVTAGSLLVILMFSEFWPRVGVGELLAITFLMALLVLTIVSALVVKPGRKLLRFLEFRSELSCLPDGPLADSPYLREFDRFRRENMP